MTDFLNLLKAFLGVPQGSILGPLFFLIYINDLSNDLKSNVKLFADDTSLFSIVRNPTVTANILNEDLETISVWADQWKMSFNPDITKQTQEVIFSRKNVKGGHPNLVFNNCNVQKVTSQKHLGIILDEKLSFNEHLKDKLNKANKGIGVLRKLYHYLPHSALLTIYKSFIRPHLDYGDVIYDQPSNACFCDKIEMIQYNASIAITGAIRGTSKGRLYRELGLEFLSDRRKLRRLCLLYKIKMNQGPQYLYDLIPKTIRVYNTRASNHIPQIPSRTQFYKDTFFPSAICEWNKLMPNICASDTFGKFRSNLLKSIRQPPKSLYFVHDRFGIKLLTRLRLDLSHLSEHKFNHNFQDTINPLCPCNLEVESVSHFFLRYLRYNQIRSTLNKIDTDILNLSGNDLVNLLLYGHEKFTPQLNTSILMCSIKYIVDSDRFSGSIL